MGLKCPLYKQGFFFWSQSWHHQWLADRTKLYRKVIIQRPEPLLTLCLHHCCSSCTGCQCQNEWHSNSASWCIAVCMVSTLNTSRRTSGSCPRFILASDCVRPPVPTSWFLPHAGLHLATEHSRLQELERERATAHCHRRTIFVLIPATPEDISFSSDNCVNNTNYCVVVLKCLALSTTLILANWNELNWQVTDSSRFIASNTVCSGQLGLLPLSGRKWVAA